MDQDSSSNKDKRSSEELHPIQRYFEYDETTDKSKCKVGDCNRSFNGRHSNNLAKHIKRNHKNINDEIHLELSAHQSEMKKQRLEKTADYVTVKINRIDFQNGLLELVNINGRPFNLFKDSGMCKILQPILKAFDESKSPVSIGRESLQRGSLTKCSNLTEKIKEEMADILFPICIDWGSACDSRSILGINTQYMCNQKMVHRCLEMKVSRHSNTALRIAVLIWHTLKRYGLKLDNMISLTSDNGGNVLKSVKILRVFQTGSVDDYLDADLKKIDYELLDQVVEVELKKPCEESFPFGIRCIAHTTNLCLGDAMEGE